MSSLGDDKVVYPVVVVMVGGTECCALLDLLVHLVVMRLQNCQTCWESRRHRLNLRRVKCLWLLLQQEWRF